MNPYATSRSRRLLVAAVAMLSLATANARVEVTDTVTTGLRTVAEHNAEPFGYRVNWIDWDSGFRDSNLKIGDRIVGVEGEPYKRGDYRRHWAIGDYRESAYWAERGVEDGQAVTLDVIREGKPVQVRGTLRAQRLYLDENDRPTLGEAGPPARDVEKDENGRRLFDTSWGSWYERKTDGKPDSFAWYLDGGWERPGFNNAKALKKHEQDRARVDFALEHYPGEFTNRLREDYERVEQYLRGQVVELPEDALAFRERAEQWQREIAEHSRQAIAAFEISLGERLDKAPGVRSGGIAALADAYVGKVVYFDGLGPRDIVNDLGQAFMVAGSDRDGYFFLRAESPGMARVFDALLRYRSLVNPRLAERYSVWIEVEDEPMLMTYKGSTISGLLGRVVALAGGRNDVFIQALGQSGSLQFAGESETQVKARCSADDASDPARVVRCLVQTVKQGDRRTWEALFATWRFTPLGAGMPPIYYPDYRVRAAVFDRAWENSRRSIMGDVLDARLNRLETVRVLHEGDPAEGVPRVEEVRAVIDHVGDFESIHRTYVDLDVHRVWRLQRLEDGPWRLADVQSL